MKCSTLRGIFVRPGVLFAVTAALAAVAPPAGAAVISVDFQPNSYFAGRAPVDFTGVESQAAAADPVFYASDIWNHLSIAPDPTFTPNPSFSGLVDSAGNATSVGISFTGTVGSADDVPIDNSGSDAVENDYILIAPANTVGYVISGLPADTSVALYLYAPNFGLPSGFNSLTSRGYQFTANGNTITVNSGPSGNALAFVTTDAGGDISGVWSSGSNEGDLSGLQIATPEPSSVTLAAGGILLALGGLLRRKRPAGR